jgi:hypothetical protein
MSQRIEEGEEDGWVIGVPNSFESGQKSWFVANLNLSSISTIHHRLTNQRVSQFAKELS